MSFYEMTKIENVLLIDLFGNIEKASAFTEDFSAISVDVKSIVLHVNSTGGNFESGKQIYEALLNHSAHKIGFVVTICGSSALLPLFACNEISMPSNAVLIFHPPRTSLEGATAAFLRQAADTLDKTTSDLLSIYQKQSNLPEDRLRELISTDDYWLDGIDAHALGFCHSITDPVAMVPVYDPTKFKRIKKEAL